MRNILYLSLVVSIAGCYHISESQYKQLDANWYCYKEMEKSFQDPKVRSQLEFLSLQTFKKQALPFFINDIKYTLIPRDKIFEVLDFYKKKTFESELDSLNDFAGIRYIDENYISFEICRIKRYTLVTHLNGHHPIETHRIVFDKRNAMFNRDHFLADDERISYSENLDYNWHYIVSVFD